MHAFTVGVAAFARRGPCQAVAAGPVAEGSVYPRALGGNVCRSRLSRAVLQRMTDVPMVRALLTLPSPACGRGSPDTTVWTGHSLRERKRRSSERFQSRPWSPGPARREVPDAGFWAGWGLGAKPAPISGGLSRCHLNGRDAL